MMPMNRDRDSDRGSAEGEHPKLPELVDRLKRERPVPGAAFRARLRHQLLTAPPGPSPLEASDWQSLAGTYVALGLLCLAVAALGLAGLGPFAGG
jgi:hypothetical protein